MLLDRLLAWDTPPRIDVAELIDDDAQPYADFRASMSDVRRANRFLGGTVVVARQARIWLEREKRDPTRDAEPLRFLDVATGSGDIPHSLLNMARKLDVPVQIVGLDYSPPILRYAREQVGHLTPIRLMRGDAFQLPLRTMRSITRCVRLRFTIGEWRGAWTPCAKWSACPGAAGSSTICAAHGQPGI